ncbi:MAG: LamG-like jellyroll fold domain-containing protein [Planctomycetota bacterium]
MSDRPITHEVLPLIEGLLDGTIGDTGFARLETILLVSTEARALYRSYTNLHAALPGIVGHAPRLSIQITDVGSGPASLEPHEVANDQLMQFLTQVEDQGEDLDPMALATERFSTSQNPSSAKREYLSALMYLYQHYVKPHIVWTAASAAALLLCAVLAIVFLTDGGPPEIAEGPEALDLTPMFPSPDPHRVVATVTDQVNAQWVTANGEGALPDRMLLAINQRLTLVQGFAKITTMRGATVLLQAPATIETTDNANAIRLLRGRLVGRCETPGSKGFVVHTPNARIIDVGTEFGVAVSKLGETVASVFEGEVELTGMTNGQASTDGLSVRAGQFKRVDPTGMRVDDADPLSIAFVRGQDFDLLSDSANALTYDRWLAQSMEIRRDPSAVLYYTFDNEDQSPHRLINQAAGTPGSFDGQINGPTWADGRLPGKRALRFRATGLRDRLGQHVEVLGSRSDALDFPKQSFSVAAWFKFGDAEEGLKNFMPIITRGDESWRLQSFEDQEKVTWDVDSEGLQKDHNVTSRSEPFDGEWRFVVAVVEADPESNHTTHRLYVDGQRETTYQLDQKRLETSSPVMLGANSDQVDHRFDGLLDEVIIFGRALTDEEISAMYELNYQWKE